MEKLDIYNNMELVRTWCVDNNLENIDVSCNKKLKILCCDRNVSPYFGDNEMRLDNCEWVNEEGEPIEAHFMYYYR